MKLSSRYAAMTLAAFRSSADTGGVEVNQARMKIARASELTCASRSIRSMWRFIRSSRRSPPQGRFSTKLTPLHLRRGALVSGAEFLGEDIHEGLVRAARDALEFAFVGLPEFRVAGPGQHLGEDAVGLGAAAN